MSDGGLHPLPRAFNAVSQLLITVAAASLNCQCLFSNFPGPHEVGDAEQGEDNDNDDRPSKQRYTHATISYMHD